MNLIDDLIKPTDQEAIAILGKPKTQANLRSAGKAPPYIRLGRRIYYRRCDLEAYLEANLRIAPNVLASDARKR